MKSDYTEIYHDAFGRYSIVRRTIHRCINPTCDWCGNKRHRNGKEIDVLFQYGIQEDSRPGSINWEKHAFCSRECHKSFTG